MRDEGATSGWHKVGHAEIDLSQKNVSILEGTGRKVSVGASAKARTIFKGVKRIHAPLVLHGINVGSISFFLQIRRISALSKEDNEESKSLLKIARHQSLTSMRMSGKHEEEDIHHISRVKSFKVHATDSSGDKTDAKDNLEADILGDTEIVAVSTDSDDNDEEEILGSISEKTTGDDNEVPPPPKLSLKERRLSASMFHMKLEPQGPPPKVDFSKLPPPPPQST